MVVQLLDKPSNAARTDLALPVLLLVFLPHYSSAGSYYVGKHAQSSLLAAVENMEA